MNLILCTDSYKTSHWKQYPQGTSGMFSYIEARSKGDFTVFFGLQAILDTYFSNSITVADVIEAEMFFAKHGVPFNRAGWTRIVEKHAGRIPMRIRAVPEGIVVPNGNVLVTIESTDPELPWVGSYFETVLLRLWYTTTVATRSYQAKQIIRNALLRTADNLSNLPFKLHDFGARGVSSGESAALGGMSHLVNFAGSDTIEGVLAASRFYNCDVSAFSIPAAEHSTITSWGRENEVEAYRNMLNQFAKPGAVLAVVSDSYDVFSACEKLWGEELRQQVIDSGALLVIRPDSGDPAQVVLKCAEILNRKFGSTVNSKGFRVLNNVRIIQGDGLDSPLDIDTILKVLEWNKFSADNIAFGMGGGLLQKLNRDTFGFAMKCSAICVNGEWRDVFKDPVTSSGKKSKCGRLTLIHDEDGYQTITEQEAAAMDWSDRRVKLLQTVYDNGSRPARTSLESVRQRTGLWSD